MPSALDLAGLATVLPAQAAAPRGAGMRAGDAGLELTEQPKA